MSSPGTEDAGGSAACLDNLQVESALLSVIAEHRPVGTHRHWNIIPILTKFKAVVDRLSSVREAEGLEVWSDTQKAEDPSAIRAKLEEWYDLAALNEMVRHPVVEQRGCHALTFTFVSQEDTGEGTSERETDDEEEDDAEEEDESRDCPKCKQGFSLLDTSDFVDLIAERGRNDDSDEEDLSELETTDADSPMKAGTKRKAAKMEDVTGEEDDEETEGEEETLATRRGTRSTNRSAGPPATRARRSGRK